MRYVGQEHTLTIAAPRPTARVARRRRSCGRALHPRVRAHVRRADGRGARDRHRPRDATHAAARPKPAARPETVDGGEPREHRGVLVHARGAARASRSRPRATLALGETARRPGASSPSRPRRPTRRRPSRPRSHPTGALIITRATCAVGRRRRRPGHHRDRSATALNSAAEQMKRALIRTAFSPVIYEVLDFAAALYDRDVEHARPGAGAAHVHGHDELLRRAAAVEAVGGEEALEPGDIILYNVPYGTGSHPQDVAVVMPVFLAEGELVGYAAIKAHWLDIGGKEPYSTDTVDVFQEGTIFPGVKLYSPRAAGQRHLPPGRGEHARAEDGGRGHQRDSWSACAPARPRSTALVERHGVATFRECVERMFDARRGGHAPWFEKLPGRPLRRPRRDGLRTASRDERVPFEVAVEIERLDRARRLHRRAAGAAGPINCPVPSTVSATRIAISMLAGGGEAPNEGHFRAIEVLTTPGTIFHPEPPAPCFLYGWAGDAGDGGHLPGALRGDARGRARLLRRRHLRAGVLGERERTRRAVDRRRPARRRPGRARRRRRRQRADAHLRGRDPGHARRGRPRPRTRG